MKYVIRKAVDTDLEKIYLLLNPYSKDGLILERSIEDIKVNIDKFFIAENNDGLIGVISYYAYTDELHEIRSLAVNRRFFKNGIGSALIKKLTAELLSLYPNSKIFALSYHPHVFKKAGFIKVLKDTLPEKIWKDCQNCKNQNDCGETALVYNKEI